MSRRRKTPTTPNSTSSIQTGIDDPEMRERRRWLAEHTARHAAREQGRAPKCAGCGVRDLDKTSDGTAVVRWYGLLACHGCRGRWPEPLGYACQRCRGQRGAEHAEFHAGRMRERQAAAVAKAAAPWRPRRPEFRVRNGCLICGDSRVQTMRTARIPAGTRASLLDVDACGPRCEACLAGADKFEGLYVLFIADRLGKWTLRRRRPWEDPDDHIEFDVSTDTYIGWVHARVRQGLDAAEADTPPGEPGERWAWLSEQTAAAAG